MTTDALQSTEELGAPQGVQYNVTFQNQTSNFVTAIIFQKYRDIYIQSASLAWLVKGCGSRSNTTFNWQANYSFVFAQSDRLVPGVKFVTAESRDCDPERENSITLSQNGFGQLKQAGQRGSLVINADSSVPRPGVLGGIGLSNDAAFAALLQPNSNLQIPARPEYWIAVGNFEKGQILEDSVSNAVRIGFEPGRTSYKVTLNADDTWAIQPQ